MNAPPLSEVKSRIKKLNELIQRLETAEDNTKTLSDEMVRSTVTNCLEVALKTLREDRSKIEDQFRQPMSN